VTNYLDRYAGDQPEKIAYLKDYFLRVLCRINQGRSAKDRVMEFLYKEAVKSEASAKFVMELYSWLSATNSIGDRAKFIEVMLELQERYPDLEGPIQVKPIEVRTGKRRSASA